MSDSVAPISAPPEVEVFPRAPVTEAILGIELPYLDDLVGYAEPFHATIKDRFPIREVVEKPDRDDFLWPKQGSAPRAIRRGEPAGYRFLSEDGLQVVQLTRRALTYHRLRPYVDWTQFEKGAIPVWNAFTESFAPEYVGSLRLRFLNRIEIPRPFGDLEEYLNMILKIPSVVDTGFTGYLMRVSLVDRGISAVAHVTQIAEHEPGSSIQVVIFDIDVRSSGEGSTDETELWGVVKALRDYKNRIFFSSITDKARSLFR